MGVASRNLACVGSKTYRSDTSQGKELNNEVWTQIAGTILLVVAGILLLVESVFLRAFFPSVMHSSDDSK